MIKNNQKKYDLGLLKEIKDGECRVALTPRDLKSLVKQGLRVLVESGAGKKSSFSDEDYLKAGAQISRTAKKLWSDCKLIVKVKEPQKSEYQYFYPGLRLFCFLHLAAEPALARALLKNRVTAFAFETYRDRSGVTTLLSPMSEIAGKLSIILGERYLCSDLSGNGSLLSCTSKTKSAKVVVLGGGFVGQAALSSALGLGAQVTLFDIRKDLFATWKKRYPDLKIKYPSAQNLEREIAQADLLIGSVHVPGKKTARIIKKEMIQSMKKGSVFVDVAIDQGGSSETSKVTSLSQPSYIEDGVIHLCIPNLPALASQSASQALSKVIVSKIKSVLSSDLSSKHFWKSTLATSVNTYQGDLLISLGL